MHILGRWPTADLFGVAWHIDNLATPELVALGEQLRIGVVGRAAQLLVAVAALVHVATHYL